MDGAIVFMQALTADASSRRPVGWAARQPRWRCRGGRQGPRRSCGPEQHREGV